MQWGFRAAVAVMLMLFGSVVQAQGTITDGAASFVRGASPFDSSPDANFTGVSPTLVQDHLFEFGWAFRVAGDAAETFFPVPTAQNYTGNTSTLDWADVGSRGLFSAQEVAVVTDTASPSGFVTVTMTITNISGADLTIDVFNMADIDLQPSAGDDTAVTGDGNHHLTLSDAGANTAAYRGLQANAHLVRPFGASDIGAVLSNASADNFDNTGTPFGPGDFTSGFQWTGVVIPSAGNASFTVVLAVNEAAVPVELMQFSVD